MKNFDAATWIGKNPSNVQELRQAFRDWVDKLPLMKMDLQKVTGRADPEKKPADQAAASEAVLWSGDGTEIKTEIGEET